MVTLSIEPRSVLEGERVTFTCHATANPPIMGYRSGLSFFLKPIFKLKLNKINALTSNSKMSGSKTNNSSQPLIAE